MNNNVAQHYMPTDDLTTRLAARLRNAGKKLDSLTTDDLAAIDEFHIRGKQATLEFAKAMKIKAGDRVLDIGSGIGGPARTLVEARGCHVTGLDLMPEYTNAAIALTNWVGMSSQLVFHTGDATSMPFNDNSFDAAVTMHSAMNISAKDLFYSEVFRVLRPGKLLGIYDVLRGAQDEVIYPVPWADSPSISHLVTATQLTKLLESAGFTVRAVIDSTSESSEWMSAMVQRWRTKGPPPLSLQVLMGEDFMKMISNLALNLQEGRINTVTCIAQRTRH